MTMSTHEKRMLDREALRSVIQQWNANRLDLFELSEPDENLQFHGVMRFYFQDEGQKVATKCIRVASDATVADVIDTLIEKFRPDMRMLSVPSYALYEVHANHEERKLNPDEKPLLVQLNWHIDDREGRFLLKNTALKTNTLESTDTNFKRKLSKREKKEQKKKEKLKMQASTNDSENHIAEKLYTELPETSFTRSISNPEAVMRRRRQQKLEKKLQQFRSRDGGPDTGGTLKIYGESLCRDVPYKTLLLSIRDCAQAVVREMLAKYGLDKADPLHYCLVQVNSDGTEYILDDDECPLSILMNHPTSRGSIMFHVRRRPADSQPRRRKKKPLGVSNGSNNVSGEREGPMLVEITHSGDGGRRIKLNSEPVEVGSANTNALQIFGPSIQPRHCLISLLDGVCTVTPLHADALTFVNGHHIQQPTVLHNGSVVMFGRGASYRFIDSPSDGRYNLALSQSQLDSACLYESRSPQSPSWNEDERPLSPVHSQNQVPNQKLGYLDSGDNSSRKLEHHQQQTPLQQQQLHNSIKTNFDHLHSHQINNNNIDTASSNGQVLGDENTKNVSAGQVLGDEKRKENFEIQATTFDVEGNIETETKSISSVKSSGSNQEIRSNKVATTGGNEQGQEPILPAVLEFPETHQESFLRQVITELDVNSPNFKLAPVYTLYLCARYRASTHYRPDLQPTERAHKLTVFLHHVANLIYNSVQEQYSDPKILSFWMANSSEFLHFLKSDRHISAFSVQSQEVLAESVQTAFRNLVSCFHVELSQTLNQFLSENIDNDSAAGLVLSVLGSAMALLRRCRVNAALTIQLFSQLFHYINVVCFNKIVTTAQMCTGVWGKLISDRLQLLELWAERQGLELAADCHLAKINQCAQFLQAPKTSVSEVQQLVCSCFRLNSLQMSALLSQEAIPRNLVDTAVRMAESVADELTRADGREVRLDESTELPLALLLPDDGFSCDVVRGIPAGLVDFLSPLQSAGMCRLAAQPTSIGFWTVYMHQYNGRSPSSMSSKLPQPEVQVIKLHKNSNGMGLSIVAAKGAGQERLGIYIKSVVPGGAADADGRLSAGDQLLRVDGQSLIGITQERAADYLVRTGPVVSLEVAKQGAIYHGLATLLQQPSPVIQRGNRRMSERDISRIGVDTKPPVQQAGQQLLNSKSVPALHHVGNIAMSGNKSRSIHNLAGNNTNNNDQGFYQNLSIYRSQNQSQPNLGDRSQMSMQSTINPIVNSTSTSSNQQILSRPASAYFNNNNNINSNTLPSQNSMSSYVMPQHNNNPNLLATTTGTTSGTQAGLTATSTRPKNFVRDSQGQQSLRLNQMMAPSMPNIAHSSGYAANISSSQSMQNVNMINPSNSTQLNYHGNFPNNNNPMMTTTSHQHLYQQDLHQQQLQQNQAAASLLRGQAKLAEMGEILKRRHQRHQDIMPPLNNLHSDTSNINNQQNTTSGNTINGGINMNPMLLSPTGNNPNMQMHPQQQQQQQQYGQHQQAMINANKPMMPTPNQYHQGVPPYNMPPGSNPVKQLPPTAPKPQMHRQHQDDPSSPPLPPTNTHPLFKGQPISNTNNPNYIGNASDPQKMGHYPPPGNVHPKTFGTNPWEREEREKEQEIRREQIRQWRDMQINELSTVPNRTQQQDEQLKNLALERDFERRALETEEQEDDNDLNYGKDNVQEVIRLSHPQNQISAPVTSMKQVEVKTQQDNSTENTNSHFALQQNAAPASQPQPPPQSSSIIQPKSILKHNNSRMDTINTSNPSSPSKQAKSASFADDRHIHENTINNAGTNPMLSQMTKEMVNLNLSVDFDGNTNTIGGLTDEFVQHESTVSHQQQQHMNYEQQNNVLQSSLPPPPPERNSSYVIMSQQQQKIRTSVSGIQQHTMPKDTINEQQTNANYLINKRHQTQPPPPMTTNNNNNNNNNILNNNLINNNNNSIINNINNNNLINNNNQSSISPPQPPMSLHQQQQLLINANNAALYAAANRDNKRVSFHDEENNLINSMTGDLAELEIIREDPNRFIQEATAILDSPGRPESGGELWNSPVQSTPGVIGAQEVYRDPRTKRLREQQLKQEQQKVGETIPEKLSFKEKMKMFALESGENQTPKDKLKISRAQRDIDAVH